MKITPLFSVIFFIFFSLAIFGQQNYFQQEVNYTIQVSLNDTKHELSAFEKIEYINNSTDTLHYLYFHLWPNAYKNKETALAKQLLENKETVMYYAKDEELGYIDSLNFLIDNQSIKWTFDPEHIDICKLSLNKPLAPNDTIYITTPFHVKLPSAKISRLGHIGQAYAITQWFPKPAVYDRYGWHPMPYLNQGEFYSEFGAFDVKITLPKNYVLAATGDRIDAIEETQWLNQKVNETEKMIAEGNYSTDNSFPPSSAELKTIHFRQYRVHDFAWFADKRFHVLKGEINVPNTGSIVDTWAFFTNSEPKLWSKALEYIGDATLFYSHLNGDYPYNHVTAIDGTISAGGGMEYPNITIIGNSGNALTLETTIMHEVGHNWFYGILGSNERDFPFLDEGLNSFYEMRYMRTKYPELTLKETFGDSKLLNYLGLNKFKHKAQYELSYLIAAARNTDQPIAIAAPKFTNYNYGGIVYSKSALVFDYLMNYIGIKRFDEAMRFYFEQWKFKHPTPDDLINTLEYQLNTNMQWFIKDLLSSNNKYDYKILKHKQLNNESHAILVKNKTKIPGPISLSGLKNGKLVGTVWYNGFKGKQVFEFPPSDIDEFRLDFEETIPEINRKNNNIRTKGIFKKSDPLQLSFLGKLDNPHYTQLNYLPILGYNQYNKFMLGCALYNYSLLQRKTEFTIAPMYAFGTNTPVGFAELTQHITQNNKILQQITINAKLKSFSYDYLNTSDFNTRNGTNIHSFPLNYYKGALNIDFELKKKYARSSITQHIGYTTTNIIADNINYTINPTLPSTSAISTNYKTSLVNNFYYSFRDSRTINPYRLLFNFQHNDQFGKASITLNYSVSFKNKNSLDFRFFAGAFVYKATNLQQDYRFRMSGFSGYQDYLFDYNYIGRNDISGIGAAQMVEQDGAFKVWTPLGQTSKWLVALNIKSPKVGKLPFKLFLDVGASEFNESLYKERFLYDVGLDICLWKDVVEIFVPFAYSNDIRNTLILNNRGNFFETIRFTLNLHNIKPKEILNNNLF